MSIWHNTAVVRMRSHGERHWTSPPVTILLLQIKASAYLSREGRGIGRLRPSATNNYSTAPCKYSHRTRGLSCKLTCLSILVHGTTREKNELLFLFFFFLVIFLFFITIIIIIIIIWIMQVAVNKLELRKPETLFAMPDATHKWIQASGCQIPGNFLPADKLRLARTLWTKASVRGLRTSREIKSILFATLLPVCTINEQIHYIIR